MSKECLFYEIQDTSFKTSGFAWASRFGLIPTGMPFLKQWQLEMLKARSKANLTPPGLIISPNGSKWPDLLGHGGGSPRFFVSELVVSSLVNLNISFSRLTEMPIAKVESWRLKVKKAPKYFVIETHPGIEVDLQASNIPVDAAGNPILEPLPKPWPPAIKVRGNSWNGLDLFDYSNFGGAPYINLLCSPKVKELAAKDKWTNVAFLPVESI